MGLVHTAIRSRLGVDKVRKTTIVGMDIKRDHIENGLVRPRAHRRFDVPTSATLVGAANTTQNNTPADIEPTELENVLDYDQLAAQLIEEAADDPDIDDDDDMNDPPIASAPPLTIRLSAQAIQSALPSSIPVQPVAKTAIPLCSLFIFPADHNAPSNGVDYFWQGGIKNLGDEMELYELLMESQDGAVTADMAGAGMEI
jgi:hypothetical protein